MEMKIWTKEVFNLKESLFSQIINMRNEALEDINRRLDDFNEFKKHCQILLEPVLEVYKMRKINFPKVSSSKDKLIINMHESFRIEFSFDPTANSEIIEIKEYIENEEPKILSYLTLPVREKEIKETIKRFLNEYTNFVSQKLKETVIKHDEKTKLQMLLQLGIPLKLFKE